MTERSRVRRMFDALEQLRDEPEVITIRRCPSSADGVVRGYWEVQTAGHCTGHSHIDLDAELMIKVLMRGQEKEMP